MSGVKDQAIDEGLFNSQSFDSQVWFQCPECETDVHITVRVPEPDFSGEKASDMISDGEVELHCTACDAVFDGYAYAGPSHCDIHIPDHPNTAVHADMPYYSQPSDADEWENYVIPENPHEIFRSTIGQLRGILEDHVNDHVKGLLIRMVFSQAITAFEAYFCDTLIKNVTASTTAMQLLLAKDGPLSQAKFPLTDILANPEIVKDEIQMSLRNRLYHKVAEVARLYENALKISIVPNRVDLERLKIDIGYRHDCVHRNGVDKEGHKLTVLTKGYVAETLCVVERFVEHTQKEIHGDEIWF
ncbi:hypothetical protein rosmuc_02929 [Roseovarius mucosus DSM 17069]|uniref:Uncharacterized protein n=1 Tax=Roseovarius mucosus DSM 17069 TaxID=1288298 RepID=A0A0A0HI40_9RHOB|nr:hypothetical protein [Roseovarius mucosus]KGM86636.1 hypothetical protein rosmuc_02929 [Roseovarius mucosus DSM 17069]